MTLNDLLEVLDKFAEFVVYDDLTGLHSDPMKVSMGFSDTCYAHQIGALLRREVRRVCRGSSDDIDYVIYVKIPEGKNKKGE